MFVGTYERPIDERGRLMLPYRGHFAQGLVLTKGQERCLYVFEIEEFERITELRSTMPVADQPDRHWDRVFFSSASSEKLDKQGRVSIHPSLQEYAALKGMCAVIGVHTRLEIWPMARWQNYLAAQDDAFSAVAEDMLFRRGNQED
jgi:MraZ protein